MSTYPAGQPNIMMASASGFPQYYTGDDMQRAAMTVLVTRCAMAMHARQLVGVRIPENVYANGGAIVYYRMPEPHVELNTSVYNALANPQDYNIDKREVRLGKSIQASVKIDTELARTNSDYRMVTQHILSRMSDAFAAAIDQAIMQELVEGAHLSNKGRGAGMICRAIDLGTLDDPTLIDANNFAAWIAQLALVMDDACMPTAGRKIILPTCLRPIVAFSLFANAGVTGRPSNFGTWASSDQAPISTAFGIDLYFTPHLPKTVVNGEAVYSVVGGVSEAAMMGFNISTVRRMQMQEAIAERVDIRGFWGFDIARPEYLINAKIKVAPPTFNNLQIARLG